MSGRALFHAPEEIDEQLRNLLRLVFHREVTAVLENMQLRSWDTLMESMRPIDDLPGVILAPDDLDRVLAELRVARGDFRSMFGVVVPDLMLKQTTLSDGPADEVNIGIERSLCQELFVLCCARDPLAEVFSV